MDKRENSAVDGQQAVDAFGENIIRPAAHSGSRYADKQPKPDKKQKQAKKKPEQDKKKPEQDKKKQDKLGKEGAQQAAEADKEVVRSGSRYADKQPKPVKKQKSKRLQPEQSQTKIKSAVVHTGSRYADKQQPVKGKKNFYSRQNETSGNRAKELNSQMKQSQEAVKTKPERSREAMKTKLETSQEAVKTKLETSQEAVKNRLEQSRSHIKTGMEKGRESLNRKTENAKKKAAALTGGLYEQAKQKGWTVRKSVITGAAVCLMVVYISMAVYYANHFYSGSMIYGIDCSRKTAAEVKNEIKNKIGSYCLKVEERNGKEDTITAEQIRLAYQDENGIEQGLKDQRGYIWPVMIMLKKHSTADVKTVYDREDIDNVMQKMNCFLPGNIVEPKDAYRGDTEDGYEVVAEVMGTTLDFEKTRSVIMNALDQGDTVISLNEQGCYIDPLVYQDDKALNQEVASLNKLLQAKITFDFSDREEVVNADVLKKWITQDDQGQFGYDDSQIRQYVEEMADRYDTFGKDRDFQTTSGETVHLSGGDYGWCMDRDATAQMLIDKIHEGAVETLEPVYVYSGMCRDTNDIGDTYVEISISRQEMWCYQDGELIVDTPVVTGNPNKNNATPAGGVWAIDAKMTDYTLRGQGYAAPVSYWMPFNGNIGIHDMQTRYYFGGTIYLTNGSHGCVNTPYDAVQTIYDIVSIGTPVVVYE